MPEVSLSIWKKYLNAHDNPHLLQTGEWGELKSTFGWDTVRIIPNDGPACQILFRRLLFGLTMAYIPKLSFENQRYIDLENEKFWTEVDVVCRKKRAIFLKIEPDRWGDQPEISNLQYTTISPHNIQPPRTVVLDLRGSEDDLLSRMKQKTRYNIRLAQKKGITVRAWDDLPAFHKMIQVTGDRDGFGVHNLEYYRRAYELFHSTGMAELLVAEYDKKPLAALMVFALGQRAWYVYGASNNQERNRMPTYLLQWEALRWAREKGALEYDLWGVPDEDEDTLEAQFTERSDGLWGVYRFKRGFGGQIKRAAQALDRVYNPFFYWLYTKYVMRNE